MPSVRGGAPAPLKVLAPPLLKITSSKPQTRTLRLRVDANCQGLPARKQQGGHLPLVDLTPEPMRSPEGGVCPTLQHLSSLCPHRATRLPSRATGGEGGGGCVSGDLTHGRSRATKASFTEGDGSPGSRVRAPGPGPREPTNKVAVGPHRCSLETSLRGHQATNPPCHGPLSAGPGWPVERRSGKVTYRPPWPVPLSGSLPSPVPLSLQTQSSVCLPQPLRRCSHRKRKAVAFCTRPGRFDEQGAIITPLLQITSKEGLNQAGEPQSTRPNHCAALPLTLPHL